MLLGKRPRPPMRRTTSLTEFSFDQGAVDNPQPSDHLSGDSPMQQRPGPAPPPTVETVAMMNNYNNNDRKHQLLLQQQQRPTHQHRDHQCRHQGPSDGLDTRYLLSMVSPRIHRRSSGEFAAAETAHFLMACGLCKRRLGPGRDTFMYRGEIAFCSLECRQQQMNQDERNEKCSLTSAKTDPPQAMAAGSEPSGNGETVAAA